MTPTGEDYEDYEGVRLNVPALPVAERVGTWWRRRWHFEISGGATGGFALPPPIADAMEGNLILTSWWPTADSLVVEVFGRTERLSADEMTYISIIGAWLRVRFSESDIKLEGTSTNAILKMSQLSPETIRMLTEYGY
jgi:hypothetical protein